VDLRWAGEPDIVLKLEPTNKWVMNALRLGAPHLRRPACPLLLSCRGRSCLKDTKDTN